MKLDAAKGFITDSMALADARTNRAAHREMGDELFKARLQSMRKIVEVGKEKAEKDALDLLHDRGLNPRPRTNHRGEPEWSTREARTLLAIGADAGLHEQVAPEELWDLRLQH